MSSPRTGILLLIRYTDNHLLLDSVDIGFSVLMRFLVPTFRTEHTISKRMRLALFHGKPGNFIFDLSLGPLAVLWSTQHQSTMSDILKKL